MFKITRESLIVGVICLLFFFAYSTLSVVRHLHYGSFGFDLGIVDQIVWKYSQLKSPITTVQFYTYTSLLTDHVELIYILLAPFYWIYNNAVTLLVLQVFFIASSGIPIYLLAKRRGLKPLVSVALLISYLSFYGIQNALWFDVHSLVFGASFLAWFIYFLDSNNTRWTIVFFLLTILCKEDMALLTLLVSTVYIVRVPRQLAVIIVGLSLFYLLAVFGIYFPFFTEDGYRYANEKGFFSDLRISNLYDTAENRSAIGYSLAWYGLLPILSPLYLLPAIGDIAHYFLFGQHISGAQGLFAHYRVALAGLLALPTIISVSRYKRLNNNYVAVYILLCAMVFQYVLHLPLSYLSKSWFWNKPASVQNINAILHYIPAHASVVAQNNIIPHITHRDEIFTLWPEKKNFSKNSPCSTNTCNWLRWDGKPEYVLVDTSHDWDIRHLLVDRESYIDAVHNLEKAGVIRKHKTIGEATLYKIQKNP